MGVILPFPGRPVLDLNDLSELKPPSGLRVLIVDDNVDAAGTLATLAQRWGHTAMIAHSCVEAVAVANTFRPRLVLLDLGLPDHHGYDLADMLRQQAGKQKLYFIAVTGWDHDEDHIRSVMSGITHHLVKPVNLDILRELLAAYAVTYDEAEQTQSA